MNVLIGWAEESLVPEKKTRLGGQFYERISEYVESPISVTAMAVESGDQQLILMSADLTSMGTHLLQQAREEFARICPGVFLFLIDLFHIGMQEKTDHSNNDIECHTEDVTHFPTGCRIKKPPDRRGGNGTCGKPQTPGEGIKGCTADQCGSSLYIFLQCRHDDLEGTIKQSVENPVSISQ